MTASRIAPRLLEREQELDTLMRAWRQARIGRGSAVLLVAEAGGGKTRLASEFARAAGARTLWGAAEPVLPPEPYLTVARALPSFRPATTRAGSIAAALDALEAAAGNGPILLVLDDLHFADEGTIAVIVRLCAACASRPWLVLATYRPGEATHLLAPLVETVAQGEARRLDLPPLSQEAIGLLLAESHGRPPDPAEAATIYAESGGNPWYAEALSRGDEAIAVVRDRLALRMDRLEAATPGARQILEALAPGTGSLPHAVVAALCGGDSRPLRRTLARLRDAGVLHEQEGAWSFRHELLRRLLLGGMIDADRRDAHQRLAEALVGQWAVGNGQPGEVMRGPTAHCLLPTAAEIAMHFAAAGDPRTVEWSLRAARAARAIDAHGEAMAQFERALSFEPAPELRRVVLEEAATEAYMVGRHTDSRRMAEEALAIPAGTPEERARLHQLAARAAHALGDLTADESHLTAAERQLAGRPVSLQMAQIAVARVARAAIAVAPDRLAAAAARARTIARGLQDAEQAAWVDVVVGRYLAVSRIECGDPAGFALLETALAGAHGRPSSASVVANVLDGGYQTAVIALFHSQAEEWRARLFEAFRRYEIGWRARGEPYEVLELVQCGAYADARRRAATVAPPAPETVEHAILVCATSLLEARAGSPARAQTLLAAAARTESFQQAAFLDIAGIELAMLADDPRLGELAQGAYGRANLRRYARLAGAAAVGLALSGRGAPPAPPWLVADAPLHVFWRWAEGIVRHDRTALRDAAAWLEQMHCPYEAALALRNAGDLAEAYRRLRALEATTVRGQVAEELRTAGQRIPRRTRAALDPDGLTETERRICGLVAAAATNDEVAAALGISARTVATHLTHIFEKTGRRGRTALAAWWRQREGGAA